MPHPADRQAPDPLTLRALAHPLRWKLIDLLGSELSATATRCAEVLGESVASCSYHLGILAKYRYIELVPGQPGREKPWRLTRRDQDLSSEGLDESGALAAQAATEVFLDHELARIKDRLRRQDLEPAEWREACHLLGVSTWLTAGELLEIKDQLLEIAHRYSGRDDDPGRRPAGAREARIFTVTSVAPRPGSRRTRAGSAGKMTTFSRLPARLGAVLRARSARTLLGHADFRGLWAAQTISVFGSQITALALPLTAVLALPCLDIPGGHAPEPCSSTSLTCLTG